MNTPSPRTVPRGVAPQNPRLQKILNMIRSRQGVIHVASSEERRFLDWLRTSVLSIGTGPGIKIFEWSVTSGGLTESRRNRSGKELEIVPETEMLDQVLETILERELEGISLRKQAGEEARVPQCIYVLLDVDERLLNEDIRAVRLLRDCAHTLRRTDSSMILLSPSLKIPTAVAKEIKVADYPLPSERELLKLLEEAEQRWEGTPYQSTLSADEREEIVRACTGLTEVEAADALAEAIIECDGLSSSVIDSIIRIKREAIRQVGCLEAVEADLGMDQVGGLDRLKEWIAKRRTTFTQEARDYGVEYPKGVLTLGVPGGGKGLSARAVAHAWRLPLLRLDMGAVMGSLVGESESNLQQAFKLVEAISPCVLWVDEIEKSFAGASGFDGDGGTTKRVFGSFLTWLQEKKAPVFVYFTANDIGSLPPELLRKGRVDELFFIDLPNDAERREIFNIHLAKRDLDLDRFDVAALAAGSRGFVGAEIEQVVKEAMIHSFSEHRPLGTRDVLRAIQSTKPLVETQRDKIKRLLTFVEEGRAVRASSGEPEDLSDLLKQPAQGSLPGLGDFRLGENGAWPSVR